MSYLSILYADDEAIAVRDAGDFRLLVPPHQRFAAGSDAWVGQFAGAPGSTAWTLTLPSVLPSNDFVAQGLAPGYVVQLTGPVNVYPPPGDMLAVDSVLSSTQLVLRRIGEPASGPGMPPAPCAGAAFLVATLAPQIERVTYDLNKRFAIDDNLFLRSTSWIYDLRELQAACVLDVLDDLYLQMSRMGDANRDVFLKKHEIIAQELDDQLDRTALHFGPLGADEAPTVRVMRLLR